MELAGFFARSLIYLAAFGLSFYGLGALDFNRFLKQGSTTQAQILYAMLVMGLAYLAGSFVIAIIHI